MSKIVTNDFDSDADSNVKNAIVKVDVADVGIDTDEIEAECDFVISFKNPELLARYMSETCKIIPAKYNSLRANQQRILKREIKRARRLGILPYCQSKKK
jgi:ribosomal protein S18